MRPGARYNLQQSYVCKTTYWGLDVMNFTSPFQSNLFYHIYVISLTTAKVATSASLVQALHVQRTNCWGIWKPHGKQGALHCALEKSENSDLWTSGVLQCTPQCKFKPKETLSWWSETYINKLKIILAKSWMKYAGLPIAFKIRQ